MTSECLLNLDMSAALRLLSVCCSHPLFSHHTDTATAGFCSSKTAALFLCTLKADSSHPSHPSHPSCLSISLTIQSTTSYDTANTSPEMTALRRRPHPEDARLHSLRYSVCVRHDTLSLHLHRQIAERIARAEERAADLQRSTRAQQHIRAPAHEYTSERRYSQRSRYASEQARGRIDGRARRWARQHVSTRAREEVERRTEETAGR